VRIGFGSATRIVIIPLHVCGERLRSARTNPDDILS
jgi:hypothetical protein